MAVLLCLQISRTMTEDALMEEEMEMNDSAAEENKKVKAKNNKEEEEAFRELETPEDLEPLPDSPILINDNNWRQLDKGEWLIEFYAPWCPACRSLQPRWDQLARDVKAFNEIRVRIAKCDVTSNPWLTGRMMIASLPTIFHIKDKEYRKYSGSRSAEDLYDYLLKKKWQDTPVLEKWREPHGAAMTAMSGFYKLANVVQSIHDTMTISYGFPVWASYVIFGLVTLACGLTAGLIIVCCMDCLSTPTTPERRAAIIEKNRRAREERERQTKLEAELEAKRKEAQEKKEGGGKQEVRHHPDAVYCREHAPPETAAQAFPRADNKSGHQRHRGNDGGEELRRRMGYQILDEDEGRSTEEEDPYGYSEDDRVDTETSETESSDYDPEDYGGPPKGVKKEEEKPEGEENKKDK